MPGLLDKIKEFATQQGDNWRTARERQDAGGNRNPWLKTDQEQAQLARDQSGGEIGQVANRAWASKMSAGSPDSVAGTSGMSFNPEDSDSVMEMQRSLNASGITDKWGKALSEDGQMGPKTLSALRSMQESRGQFIGPEGSDEKGLNEDYQEDHGRLNENENPLMNPSNWWDKLTGRTPEEGHIQEYNPQMKAAEPGGRMGAYKRPSGGGGRMY